MDRLADRDPKLSKLAELIGDIRFGVLTTIAEDGSLWSRPISTQQANPDGHWTVRTGPCPSCSTSHARCSHRAFPAALGLGQTARQAAEDLLRRLNSQRDCVADRWHRDKVEQAIADVREFLAQGSRERASTG